MAADLEKENMTEEEKENLNTEEAVTENNKEPETDSESPAADNREPQTADNKEAEAEEKADGTETAEEASAAEGKEEPGKEKKKGFFGKKEKKDPKDEKIADLTDKLTRQMAEFDNFRKRTEREKSQMYEIGAKDIIEKMLPVADNFERGLGAVPEEEREDPFVQGMDKIYKQLMTTLEEIGVKPIEAVGQEFNPDLHNAVMHVEDEELGANVIAEEFQKGYTYRDSVVRHSMVKVAN